MVIIQGARERSRKKYVLIVQGRLLVIKEVHSFLDLSSIFDVNFKRKEKMEKASEREGCRAGASHRVIIQQKKKEERKLENRRRKGGANEQRGNRIMHSKRTLTKRF